MGCVWYLGLGVVLFEQGRPTAILCARFGVDFGGVWRIDGLLWGGWGKMVSPTSEEGLVGELSAFMLDLCSYMGHPRTRA